MAKLPQHLAFLAISLAGSTPLVALGAPSFVELHTAIWHAMKAEVLKGYAQSRH